MLGEAAAQVSETTVHRHPEIPWRQPVLLRNRIVHGYWSIDVAILVATASNQLPGFVAQLRAVHDTLDDASRESPPDPTGHVADESCPSQPGGSISGIQDSIQ